jgi:hypothetical protein
MHSEINFEEPDFIIAAKLLAKNLASDLLEKSDLIHSPQWNVDLSAFAIVVASALLKEIVTASTHEDLTMPMMLVGLRSYIMMFDVNCQIEATQVFSA